MRGAKIKTKKTKIMKTTGRTSYFQELEENPQKPFLEDIRKDIIRIDHLFSQKDAKAIKKSMIKELLDSI